MDGEDWLARDWAAANRRASPVPDLSKAEPQVPQPYAARSATAAPSIGIADDGPLLDLSFRPPRRATPVHIWLTRLWALVKMGSLAASTWWAMSSIHAHLGDVICAYGAVALFSGVGARWRKRYFGPGQLLEPELYEALGSLMYRAGTALVLVGGVLAMAVPGLRA